MNQIQYCIVSLSIILLSSAVSLCAEPDADLLMGKVVLGSKLKPDTKARKEIAVIASKIMKNKGTGAVRLKGDFPGAENTDDYMLNSIFIAREIEQQLKPLLKNRFQTFLTASKYSGEKKAGPNTIEILFYPRELKTEDMESLRYKSVQQNDTPKPVGIQEGQVQETVQQRYEVVEPVPVRAETDNRLKDSKKKKISQDSEDHVKANALVEKVKARAAERARREALKSAQPK